METYTTSGIIKLLKEKGVSLFTASDFSRLFGIDNKNTVYKKLQRLKNKEIIKPLIKGKYISLLWPPGDFSLANFLYPPSYISLETALSFYGIITGFSYQITSITVKKTRNFAVDSRDFQYSQISGKLFWGYDKKEDFLIADREKALLDYVYFGTKGLRNLSFDEFDLTEINKQKLAIYAKKFDNKIYDYIRTNKKFS